MVSTMDYNIKPKLKLTQKEKEANDFLAIKKLGDYYIKDSQFNKESYAKARRLAESRLLEEDYDSVLKSYKNQELKNTRGDLRNLPLIEPLLNLLGGEKSKSLFNYHVKANNQDTYNIYTEQFKEQAVKSLENDFAIAFNAVSDTQLQTDSNIPPVKEVRSKFTKSWKDSRALEGQRILNNLKGRKDLKSLFTKAYERDWISTGEVYIFVTKDSEDVNFELEFPENVWVRYSALSDKAEDGEVVIRKMKWTLSDIVDKFSVELSTKTIGNENALDWLINLIDLTQNQNVPELSTNIKTEQYIKDTIHDVGLGDNFESVLSDGYLDIYYVAFKVLKKYKILKYIDEFGQVVDKEVDENYKLNKTHSITKSKWERFNEAEQLNFRVTNAGEDIYADSIWIEEVWHYYKVPPTTNSDSPLDIDKALYLQLEKHPVQRNILNNNSKCKLPVVGRVDGTSIPILLENYQRSYNIVALMEERSLAKDTGMYTLFPYNLIPDIEGWGGKNNPGERLETMLYYRDVLGILLYDGSDNRASALAGTLKNMDGSTIKYVEQFANLKARIKAEAWDAIGMNRNRWGDTRASEGKGKNEQDIFRSTMHTASINSKFNKVEESLLLAALDCSKTIKKYQEGTVLTEYPSLLNFISDTTEAVYKVGGQQHIETEYDISIVPSTEDAERMELLKQLIQPLAQNIGNGAPIEMVTASIMSDNPMEATKFITDAYNLMQQSIAEKEQAQLKSQEDIAAATNEANKAQSDIATELEYAKLESDKYIAELQEATKREALNITNSTGEIKDTSTEDRRLNLQENKNNQDYTLTRTRDNRKYEVDKEKLRLDKLKINSQNKSNNTKN